METNELISRISRADITADERLEALGEVMKKVRSGEIETPERGIFVNNHIHTSYSFSPYTPTSALFNAWRAGLRTAGIMDHDSVGGMREFIRAGEIIGMPITCGIRMQSERRHNTARRQKNQQPRPVLLRISCNARNPASEHRQG